MKQLGTTKWIGFLTAFLLLLSTALTAQAAINNETLNDRINSYLEDGKTLSEASTTLAQAMTQEAVDALASPLNQESLEELIFNIAAQCRALQDSGLLAGDIFFEDVFSGISALTATITDFETNADGIRTAAENGWGTPGEAEAFETPGRGGFGKMQRNRTRARVQGDLNPASPI